MTGTVCRPYEFGCRRHSPAYDRDHKIYPMPRYENKDKDMEILKWLPVVEDYARNCPAGDYLRIVSSFLHGKPRSYFQSKYDSYKASHGDAEPADPRVFSRETMISGYSLSNQTQIH
jgi:hypothetical protein